VALRDWQIVPHVRVDMATNGWIFERAGSGPTFLVEVTSLVQMVAELCGLVLVLWLLKALLLDSTKRTGRYYG
jgi:hypothetical protein